MSTDGPPTPRLRLRTLLVQGASLVALAALCERGLLFLANVLCARMSGPENYGTYGLAIQTAGALASQASLGIGLVATRFAAEFPVGHPQNRAFVRRILQLSAGLAVLASILMLLLAWPLAHWFYNRPLLFQVLLVALLSAPAFVLLEAVRGLLLGQMYHRGLLILSLIFGVLMILLLPPAAIKGPRWMVATHALCCLVALSVVITVLVRKYHLLEPNEVAEELPLVRMLRFGILQVGSGTAINLVMILMMALLVRSSPAEESLAAAMIPLGGAILNGTALMMTVGLAFSPLFGLREVGYYNAASSIRNLTSLLPGLMLQVTYGLMTDRRGEQYGGVNRILLINTWLAAFYIVPVVGLGIAIMPWLLPFFFGPSFAEGVVPACYLLAVAAVHTVSQASVNRLSVLRARTLGLVNLFWVAVATVSGLLLVPAEGATGVAKSLLIAHASTMLVVPETLRLYRGLPPGLWYLTLLGFTGALLPLVWLQSSLYDGTLYDLTSGSRLLMLASSLLVTILLWFARGMIRGGQHE
jgi:O-antigen/teichoic acid export membrane protein